MLELILEGKHAKQTITTKLRKIVFFKHRYDHASLSSEKRNLRNINKNKHFNIKKFFYI